MIIYRVSHLTSGKVYIGKWQGPRVENRWKTHIRVALGGSPYYFHRAIRDHGPDAFKVEVLYRAKTNDPRELSRMETFFIILHQSHKSENGYNLTLGGEGVSANEEVRRKMREHHADVKGSKNPNFGVKASPETRALMKKNHVDLSGSKNGNFGKKMPLETQLRMSRNHADVSGDKNPNSKVRREERACA